MKILHLSDSALPDWRIQKSASSSKKRGDLIYFGGPKISGPNNTGFDKLYEISWSSHAKNKLPYYWNLVKKQMTQVIREVRPDIIHAHNIFSAKMASEIDYCSMIYDDHEYWSMIGLIKMEANTHRDRKKSDHQNSFANLYKKFVIKYLDRRFTKIWGKIEKDLISRYPTITVSDPIMRDFLQFGKKIFLVPNYPRWEEIENLPEPVYHTTLSSLYAGVRPRGAASLRHMNMNGFFDLFEQGNIGKLIVLGWNKSTTTNISYKGLLNRSQMYKEMQGNSIGFIPFQKHWFHRFISPNKAYEYAHAGLLVWFTSSLTCISHDLKEHCISFDNYEDLLIKVNMIRTDLDNIFSRRVKSYFYARNNLLWEKFEANIFASYKIS